MAVKRITAIGDSIVDTVMRGGVTDTTQWLYKLAQALGETDIRMEPLPECSLTPSAFTITQSWTDHPELMGEPSEQFVQLTGTQIIPIRSSSGGAMLTFALMAYTQDTAFTCQVYSSLDNVTWEPTPLGTITKSAGHEAGWYFCNWGSPDGKNASYLKLVITGTMTVSSVKPCVNAKKDRGTCLNRIVGQNYIINNVGVGSAKTGACLARFQQDVIDLGSDYVIILAGINDIAGDKAENADTGGVCDRLDQMYTMAEENGITVIPCTLLPYASSGLAYLFDVISPRIKTINNWIRETSAVRRFNLSDWYDVMEDDNRPGYMWDAYEDDGVHLNVAGCTAIINGFNGRPPAFDLGVFSIETHDLYAMPVVKIDVMGYRFGDDAFFEFWNGVERNFKIYKAGTPGVDFTSTLVATVAVTNTGIPEPGQYYYPTENSGYYRIYGVDTDVWSDEVFVVGKVAASGGTVLTPFPMMLGR